MKLIVKLKENYKLNYKSTSDNNAGSFQLTLLMLNIFVILSGSLTQFDIKFDLVFHFYDSVVGGGPMVQWLHSDINVRKFELYSCLYVHFQTNTLGKSMYPPYPPQQWIR